MGHVWENGEWSPEMVISENVSPVKFVLGVFIHPEDSPDAWGELVVGNACDSRIKITEIQLKFQEGVPEDQDNGPQVTLAPSRYDSRVSDGECGYLWGEPETGWESMYEEYNRLNTDSSFFDHECRSVSSADKVHCYELGEGENEQCVVSTPVEYESPTQLRVEGDSHVFDINTLRTLDTTTNPVLYPTKTVREDVEDSVEADYREYVDCISLWVKWDAVAFEAYKQAGKYQTQFEFESEIGVVKHYYAYYTIPPYAQFIMSNSPAKVESWGPADTRKMFDEWSHRYGIQRVSSGGSQATNESAEAGDMFRSQVRSADSVKNGFQYEIPNQAEAEQGLKEALNLALAIIGSVAIALLLQEITPSRLIISALILIGCVLVLLWTNLRTSIIEKLSQWMSR